MPKAVISMLPGVDADGDVLLLGGVDFGEAVLVPEMGIPQVSELTTTKS